eukprot:GHVO01023526.1.p1 GENE.GHVO01023526.1~~GHVO01023526.1.p1  ORF type:complete len:148 (+),score=6.41 GHVO01023526.1:110-553(+)
MMSSQHPCTYHSACALCQLSECDDSVCQLRLMCVNCVLSIAAAPTSSWCMWCGIKIDSCRVGCSSRRAIQIYILPPFLAFYNLPTQAKPFHKESAQAVHTQAKQSAAVRADQTSVREKENSHTYSLSPIVKDTNRILDELLEALKKI